MTSREPSPELAALLRGSRPAASPELRARVREIAAGQAVKAPPLWSRLRLPSRRAALVVLPAAAALAIASAGVLGLARSDGGREATVADRADQSYGQPESGAEKAFPETASPLGAGAADATAPSATAQGAGAPLVGTGDRAQRVTATMTVEVDDSDGVADSAQKAIALTQRLGGYVASSSVVTGDDANAVITVRIPAARVQEAVTALSALGHDRLAAGPDAGSPGRPEPARAARALGARADRADRRPARVRAARPRQAGRPRDAAQATCATSSGHCAAASQERTPRRAWRRSSSRS